MPRTASFLVLATLLQGGVVLSSAQSSGEPLRAEIRHAKATPYDIGDPDVAAFHLEFDIRLTNKSKRPIEIPKAAPYPSTREPAPTATPIKIDDDENTQVVVIGVQAKQHDGTWADVVQSSWYGSGTEKYEPCTSLPPDAAAELTNLKDGLVLLKEQLTRLGSEPTVRFTLMIFCRQANGKALSKTVRTEGFELRLPLGFK